MSRHCCSILVIACALSACRDPQADALKQLVNKGYALSVADLFEAAEKNDLPALPLFIAAGVAPNVRNAEGRSALEVAAHAGHTEAFGALLNLGAAMPSSPSDQGRLLNAAIQSHALPMLEDVIRAGANPALAPEPYPLAIAASEQQRAMLDALIEPCVLQLDTALLAASEHADTGVVSRLLNAGASVFAREPTKRATPLIIAARAGHVDAAKLLLDAGAHRLALDSEGHCAAELAEAGLHVELAKHLRDPSIDAPPGLPLAGGVLSISPTVLAEEMLMLGCCATVLPFAVEEVAADKVKVKAPGRTKPVSLDIGAPIPATEWKLEKQAQGGAVFRRSGSQERLLLIPGQLARHEGPSARLCLSRAPERVYEASVGDEFTLEGDTHTKLIVREVSPLRVLIVSGASDTERWEIKLGGKAAR